MVTTNNTHNQSVLENNNSLLRAGWFLDELDKEMLKYFQDILFLYCVDYGQVPKLQF